MNDFIAAVRGAVQVPADSESEIREAMAALFDEIMSVNGLKTEDMVSIIISCTKDIRSFNPATALRIERDVASIPLFCLQEFDWENAMPRVIRFLIHLRHGQEGALPIPVYLNGAENLRPDIRRN